MFDNACVVIERKPGVRGWVEDGTRFPLPLRAGFDSIRTIPAPRLGRVLRAYERHHPSDGLRELLTGKPQRGGMND